MINLIAALPHDTIRFIVLLADASAISFTTAVIAFGEPRPPTPVRRSAKREGT